MLSLGSSKTKYSLTNTFLTLTNSLFNFTTSQNGEKRAIVPINAWENVLPMDILPNPLYRAILSQDIEEMEKLGYGSVMMKILRYARLHALVK